MDHLVRELQLPTLLVGKTSFLTYPSWEPGWLSRYSEVLSGPSSVSGKSKGFFSTPQCPERPWDPPRPLSNVYECNPVRMCSWPLASIYAKAKNVGAMTQPPTHVHDVVLSNLSTEETLPLTYPSYHFRVKGYFPQYKSCRLSAAVQELEATFRSTRAAGYLPQYKS
jgi:hypothetical protein